MLSLHGLRKLCYSGLAVCSRLGDIWSTRASLGWGSYVCCILSDPPSQLLPPPTPLIYRETQTDRVWLGRAVASPRCARSSAYLESICLLPLTDPEPAGLSAAPLSVPYGLGWRGAKGGGSGRCRAGEGESGLGITVPKYASFFIFVFLKKYRLCYQEEEE